MKRSMLFTLLAGIFLLTFYESSGTERKRGYIGVVEVTGGVSEEDIMGTEDESWIEVDIKRGVEKRRSSTKIGIDRDEDSLEVEPVSFVWPIQWKGATSSWGYRRDPVTGELGVKHSGIDLKAEVGTPVYAPAEGVVRVAGWIDGYGWTVILDHHNGYSTRFGHLSRYLVEAGDAVSRGEVIAQTGNSGRSTGPHLHYEIRKDEVALNPLEFKEGNTAEEESERKQDEVVMKY